MKTNRLVAALTALLVVFLLSSCGPSTIGFRTGPHFGPGPWVGAGGWVGPGVWGPRPWVGFHRPPVIINRHYQGSPRYGYNNRLYNNPYSGYRGNYGGYRSSGPGYGGSRGPR